MVPIHGWRLVIVPCGLILCASLVRFCLWCVPNLRSKDPWEWAGFWKRFFAAVHRSQNCAHVFTGALESVPSLIRSRNCVRIVQRHFPRRRPFIHTAIRHRINQATQLRTSPFLSFNGRGGRVGLFSPFWEGTTGKYPPPGDMIDQPPWKRSSIRSQFAEHVWDDVFLSPGGAVLVTSPGEKRRIPLLSIVDRFVPVGVYCRESAVTGPVVLEVVPVTGAAFSGCAPLFSHTHYWYIGMERTFAIQKVYRRRHGFWHYY